MCSKCSILIDKFLNFRQNCIEAFELLEMINKKYRNNSQEEAEPEVEKNSDLSQVLGLVIEKMNDGSEVIKIEDDFYVETNVWEPSTPKQEENEELEVVEPVKDEISEDRTIPKGGICPICGQYRVKLIEHMKIHPDEGPLKCVDCDLRFTQEYCLKRHRSKFHPIKPRKALTPAADVNPVREVLDVDELMNILTEQDEDDSEKIIKEFCLPKEPSTTFETVEVELQNPEINKTAIILDDPSTVAKPKIRWQDKVYPCNDCGHVFNHPHHLKKHKNMKRPCWAPKTAAEKGNSNRSGICEHCGVFKKHLDIHMISHRDERKYACHLCDKRFKMKSILIRHVNIHLDNRPYKCSFCEKSFNDPSSLRIHLPVHTGEKKYICEFCERPFGSCSARARHHLTHTQDRKFECQYCGRAFLSKDQLSKHERIHTGEKPYQCNYCDKRFNVHSNCIDHMRRLHRLEYRAELEMEID